MSDIKIKLGRTILEAGVLDTLMMSLAFQTTRDVTRDVTI